MPAPRYGQRSLSKQPVTGGVKRPAPSSNVTSTESSDIDDDENGELPDSGLVAPWEVLRGLADVAIERAAKVGFDIFSSLLCLTKDSIAHVTYVILHYGLFRKMAKEVSHTVGREHPRPKGIGT